MTGRGTHAAGAAKAIPIGIAESETLWPWACDHPLTTPSGALPGRVSRCFSPGFDESGR